MSTTTPRIAAIDLFAGAGGLGLGAAAAGCDVRLSVDIDRICCWTLDQNRALHGSNILDADVSSITGRALRKHAALGAREPLIVIGGPPCQPFSKAAYWTDSGEEAKYRRDRARGIAASRPEPPSLAKQDERRPLVQEFLRLVTEAGADGFLFENVPSITHPRNKVVLQTFIAAAESAGYQTTFVRANAVEFGVPQRRERVFVLASRRRRPEAPQPTHSMKPSIFDLLPAPTAGPALTPFAGDEYFEPEEVVSGRWAQHLVEVPPGWNYKAHTAWGGHPSPTFETETRFWNFLLKLHPDLPSWTIPAAPGPWTGPFHWDTRRLRTPELAALQCFPGGYRFAGSRRDRVRQIGNAVPVSLADAMVGQVVDSLIASQNGEGSRARAPRLTARGG